MRDKEQVQQLEHTIEENPIDKGHREHLDCVGKTRAKRTKEGLDQVYNGGYSS